MTSDDLIRPNTLRSNLHSSYFMTLGKAVAVAQHFESICRSVADFADVKVAFASKEVEANESDLAVLFTTIKKRMLHGAVNRIRGFPKINDTIISLLSKAKDARNRIAHDCALSSINPLADNEAIWQSLTYLRNDVHLIAEADLFVCVILHRMNGNEAPYMPRNYVQDISEWVFSAFTAEDLEEADKLDCLDASDPNGFQKSHK